MAIARPPPPHPGLATAALAAAAAERCGDGGLGEVQALGRLLQVGKGLGGFVVAARGEEGCWDFNFDMELGGPAISCD